MNSSTEVKLRAARVDLDLIDLAFMSTMHPSMRSIGSAIKLISAQEIPYTEKHHHMQFEMFNLYSSKGVFDNTFLGCLDAPRLVLDSGLAFVDLRGS